MNVHADDISMPRGVVHSACRCRSSSMRAKGAIASSGAQDLARGNILRLGEPRTRDVRIAYEGRALRHTASCVPVIDSDVLCAIPQRGDREHLTGRSACSRSGMMSS